MWRIYKACFNDWGLWLAFILALACYLLASGGQIGMTLDSYYYLSAAENWANSKQLIDYQGNIYANWPPLYPLLLSLGMPDVLAFAVWIHGFALSAGIYFFARCLPDRLPMSVRNAALLSYALYAPLLACSIYLWSEVVFMALLLATFAAFLRKEKPEMLFLYIILANLMCLQRNAGIFFVAAWTLSQFFTTISARELSPGAQRNKFSVRPIGSERKLPQSDLQGLTAIDKLIFIARWIISKPFLIKIKRLCKIGTEGSLAAIAFIGWQLRNFLWVRDAQDFRQNIALIDFAESVKLSWAAMSTWILPLQVPQAVRVSVLAALFGAVMLLFFRSAVRRDLLPLLLTFGCYLIGTWALRMNIASENDRYFLPLFPFFLLLSVLLLQQIRSKKLAALFMLALMSYQVARGVKNTLMWHHTRQNLSFGILHH
ncbi:hypothetical protein [Rhodoflexus sp.]